MAAPTITAYPSYKHYVHNGEINLADTGKINLALITYLGAYNAAHTIWADLSTYEVATGAGYTTGGEPLASLSVTSARFDADDVTWSSLTKTFRAGILYQNDTYKTIVKPLIAFILFDSAPADIVMAGINFQVIWNGAGIITF